ncbi:MAG: PadR family transcriptional regulator [Kastovskya adunca ATA6-11-RM4]|jgi:DNA-binding PadR family transcriptional regulator|nr:PadR family transcriptional regulator [Kastovskya adunca ATA6-11-RM4]
MLELATLGLLQCQPLHGYRLKQQLELFMSSCISVNYGAIYPLLKRLEEKGAITATSVLEEDNAGPTRKTYQITEKGRQQWHQEMLQHPHESWVNSRSRFVIKFFFFSHLEPTNRLKLLEQRLSVCRLRLESVEAEHPLMSDHYQEAVRQRFFRVLQSEISWLQEQLSWEEKVSSTAQGQGASNKPPTRQ